MLSRTYAILDEAQKGPLLDLEQGALIVSCNTPSTNRNRMVRGSIGRNSLAGGIFGFECVFYGTDTLATFCSVGLASGKMGLSTYAGGTGVENIGLLPGDGEIQVNGSMAAATEAYGQRAIFTVVLDSTDPAHPVAYFYADGSAIYGHILPAGTYYPAVTVGSPDAAYELRAFCNFGQRKMKRVVPTSTGGTIDGWYAGRTSPRRVHFIPTDSGGAAILDTDANLVSYAPRITNGDGFSFSRKCTVWTQKGRTAGTTFGQLEIDNLDGAYDDLMQDDYRDAIVRISVFKADNDLVVYPNASKITLATGVVDRIDSIGEDSIRITIKGALAKLQKPLQTDIILPFYDPGAANTSTPITLGACRNVAPTLLEQINGRFSYVMHDAPLTNIARVRDKGAPLSPCSRPPQYVPSADLTGVILEVQPEGKLTVDISSMGSQVIIPGVSDVLAGRGEFNDWPVPASPPTDWTGGGTGTRSRINASAPFYARLLTSVFYEGSGGFEGIWLRTTANVFLPGKNYRIAFKIAASQGGASAYGPNGVPYGLMLRTNLTRLPNGAITPNLLPISQPNTGAFDNYTFTYQSPAGSARPLYIIVTAPQSTIIGLGQGPGSVTVYDVKIELLGEVTQTLPLEGIKFADYYREVFTRAGLTQAEWSLTDAQQLDVPITVNGTVFYRDFGYHISNGQQVTAYTAAMAPMDGITGAIFDDADGVIRIRELIDPRWYGRPGAPPVSLGVVAEFDTTIIKHGMQIEADNAPGLTTAAGARTNWSRYSDSDFVSDLDVVSLATQAQFKRESQLMSTTAYSMSSSYTNAINAPPLATLFDDIEVAEYMRDRTLYSYSTLVDPPKFTRFTVYFDDVTTIPVMYFGDYVNITYPRFGFEAERMVTVMDTTCWPHAGIIEVVVWGGQ